jgi:hypothetical protein
LKAREKLYVDELIASAQAWLPAVEAAPASTQLGQCRAGSQPPRPRLDRRTSPTRRSSYGLRKARGEGDSWPGPLVVRPRTI